MPRDSSPIPELLRVALARPGAPVRGDRVLIAVSGGPDSMALLVGLAEMAAAYDLGLSAAHLDHGLRGEDGTHERALVEAQCRALGIACAVERLALSPGRGLEARARRARHAALRAMADGSGAAAVAFAHTMDDQAETVLLRLVRGAGRRGLGGMRSRAGRLWRPLLGATRGDIRRFLAERGVPFAVDRSNADMGHARNRMRRWVLPLLAEAFNPAVVAGLAALADRLREEDDVLDRLATAQAAELIRERRLATAVVAVPTGIGRRVVQAWLAGKSATMPEARHVDAVLRLAAGEGEGSVALVAGDGEVRRVGDGLVWRRCRREGPPAFALPIAPGATVTGPGAAWTVALASPAPVETTGAPENATTAIFDAERLPTGLILRSRRAGDRVVVPGVGTRKLQDVLIDAKVPQEARSQVPVLVAGDEVLWVAGVLRGAGARVTPATREVVVARIVTETPGR